MHRMDVTGRDTSGDGHGRGEVVRGPLTPRHLSGRSARQAHRG
jgi:hypothetical protein